MTGAEESRSAWTTTTVPTDIPTTPHRAARRVRRLPSRNVLPGSRRTSHRRRGGAARGLGDGAGSATGLRRGVGRPWRVVRAGSDSGRRQRASVRSGTGHLRDAGCDGGYRDRCEPRRPSGWSGQRAGAAGHKTDRPHRRADRTPRAVGGRRPALRPRHIGCARLLRVRSFRSSVVADGRRCVCRFGAAGRSSTRRWAPRSGIGRRRWHTRR